MCFLKKITVLLLMAGCSNHSPHKHKGIVGRPLDEVVKCIQENHSYADILSPQKSQTFEVYMTPLPDENGHLSDEGIVQVSGDS